MRYRYGKWVKNQRDEGKKPYLLMFLLSALMLAFSCVLQEGIAFYRQRGAEFTAAEYWLFFAIAAFLLLLCYALAIYYWRLRIRWGWAIFFFAIALGNSLAIWLFPAAVSGSVTRYWGEVQAYSYSLGEMTRVRYHLDYLQACFLFYYLFAMLPHLLRSRRAFLPVFYGIIAFALVAIGYSFFKDAAVYRVFFDRNRPADASVYASSFFGNRNTYGTALLLGILSTAYVHIDRRYFWNYLLIGFQFFMLLFVFSKTALTLAIAFLLSFFLYRFFDNLAQGRRFKAIFLFLLVLAGAATFLYLDAQNLFLRGSVFDKLLASLRTSLSSYKSEGLKNRTEIWNACLAFQKTHPLALWLGVGEQNDYLLLAAMFGEPFGRLFFEHNGLIHQLFAGGLLRLACYAFIVCLFVYKNIAAIAKREKMGWISFLLLLTILAHGIVETTSLLMPDTKGVVLLYMTLPLFVTQKKEGPTEEKKGLQAA